MIQFNSSVTFIAQLMGISWGALAGAFLGPFLYGLYWKKTTAAACWVSFFVATGIMVLNMLFRSSFPALLQSPINAGVFTMALNLILVPLVSSVTAKPDQDLVDSAFACYETPTQAPLRVTLGK
jgi:Na+(H+)/acetate symporter ActP